MSVEQEHMDTGRGTSYTGICCGEKWEGQQGVGSLGEIAWGEMPDIVCTSSEINKFKKKRKIY